MTSQEIRKQFLDFFAAKGHAIVESSPVVPHDDPTLMFTNAGMNQFKDVFLGTGSRPYTRAANTQKCIRAGGKHNDLDDVGQDTYHHTFFEMLGNWSFGDYFKKEAIAWAWELLTKVWGVDKSRLHATYFQGDDAEGLEPDAEAAELWRTVTDITPNHIHPGSKKDNFWEMGETGPCGPCSEIHIDLTPDKTGRSLVNKGDARVMEMWNLVFIQYNRDAAAKLTPLPAKHVDTGMGFERLCAVLQGKTSNYDTDVFGPIFEAIQKRTSAPPYQGTLPSNEATKRRSDGEPQSTIDNRQSTIMRDVSYRVIADHIRTLTFAITDGAVPSNEGRGYVLRRILRRAVRYGRQYLNMHEPFLCDLVEPLVAHMGEVFPELRSAHNRRNVRHVCDLIRDEETSFLRTLDRGLSLLDRLCAQVIANEIASQKGWEPIGISTAWWPEHEGTSASPPAGSHWSLSFETTGGVVERIRLLEASASGAAKYISVPLTIPGEAAFELHDTYGFPIDLTELIARERGFLIDVAEYEKQMQMARERARQFRESKTFLQGVELSQYGPTEFVGYQDTVDVEVTVRAVYNTKDEHLSETSCLNEGDPGALVLRETPFYAEQGGQVGDRGTIEGVSEKWGFEVSDTQKIGNAFLHLGRCTSGSITKPTKPPVASRRPEPAPMLPEYPSKRVRGDAIASVEVGRRFPTMQHHTSTHILNWALREVLGDHVQQKGSLVDPEKTRFDFSHNQPLTDEELARIEDLCNKQIVADLPVYAKEVDQKQAREINTLRAVFGEKYPDIVRVVSIGADIGAMLADPKNPKWMKYSVEFCGGTHLKSSLEAGRFVLISEEGVAKGVRRVVGVAADAARLARGRGDELLEIADAIRKGSPWRDPGYDVGRLMRELAEAVIPIQTRHRLAGQIAALQEYSKEQEKKAAVEAGRGALEVVAELLAANAQNINGVTVLVGEVPNATADALRSGIDYVRNKKGASAVLLATIEGEKVVLVAGISKDIVDRGIKAGDLIKEIAPLVGGKGGGRPDMAQGGGTDATGLPDALHRAKEWIGERLR